MTVYHLTY